MKGKVAIISPKVVEDFYTSDKNKIAFWISRLERYDKPKVLTACTMAGANQATAEQVAAEIDRYVDNRMKMSDVRPLIFALLQRYDKAAAARFKGREIFVRTSAARFEAWNREKIVRSLVRETDISQELAGQIAADAENFIRTANLSSVSSQLVREIVNVKLLEYGLEDVQKRYARLGTPVYDIERMIAQSKSTDIKRENANQMHAPETINWVISGEALEQYALTRLIPPAIADAHISGDFHLHILSMFATRPNCIQHFPPLFFKYGLKIDGTGRHTSVARPPKHLMVAIQHTAKMMLAGQTQMAGGQSVDCFNVWLAPFIRGLDERQIRQAAQEFIYELNQCLDYDSPIILIDDSGEHVVRIGEFVDSKLSGNNKAVLTEHLYTYTLDADLKLKKTAIKAVARRHAERGLELRTRNGHSIVLTPEHPVFTLHNGELTPVPAKQLGAGAVVATYRALDTNFKTQTMNLIELFTQRLDARELAKVYITGFKQLSDTIASDRRISMAELFRAVDVPEKRFRRWRERDSAPIAIVGKLQKLYGIKDLSYLKIKASAGSYVRLPVILDLDTTLARFLGYYVAEGHGMADGNTIKISTGSSEVAGDLDKFSRRFGINVRKVTENDFDISGRVLWNLVVKVFGCGRLAEQKRVPNIIFTANKEFVHNFLAAYFSGDGGFWEDWCGCTTVSKMLAHDVLALLLKFGITATIKKRPKEPYQEQFVVGIFGRDNIEKFREIGFTVSAKQARLKHYLDKMGKLRTRTRDVIPVTPELRELLRRTGTPPQTAFVTRTKLAELMAKPDGGLSLLSEDVAWDILESVHETAPSRFVYDIETDEHSFLAGFGFGFLVHNSYVARGGQVVFSNVNFELGIPAWLKDVPAVGPGGNIVGTYGDYEAEALAFLREYVKCKLEGDGSPGHKPHFWPNDVFKIRTGTFNNGFQEELMLIHQYIAKFGTPYIANGVPGWQTEHCNYMVGVER